MSSEADWKDSNPGVHFEKAVKLRTYRKDIQEDMGRGGQHLNDK
jgi:hypothetical protein